MTISRGLMLLAVLASCASGAVDVSCSRRSVTAGCGVTRYEVLPGVASAEARVQQASVCAGDQDGLVDISMQVEAAPPSMVPQGYNQTWGMAVLDVTGLVQVAQVRVFLAGPDNATSAALSEELFNVTLVDTGLDSSTDLPFFSTVDHASGAWSFTIRNVSLPIDVCTSVRPVSFFTHSISLHQSLCLPSHVADLTACMPDAMSPPAGDLDPALAAIVFLVFLAPAAVVVAARVAQRRRSDRAAVARLRADAERQMADRSRVV